MRFISIPFLALALMASCASSEKKADMADNAVDATEAMVDEGKKEMADAAPNDIVAVAVGNGSFKTLVAAVQAAGLVETLQGEGPFTVFAPTDEAFAKLPEGTVEGLLADKEKLTAILTYHVVSGKVMAADVANITSATTVQGYGAFASC